MRLNSRQRLCRFEILELRQLLSANLGLPQGFIAFPQTRTTKPFGSVNPVGFTPAQIRQAYGFNNIFFTGGIKGDGKGQTIAIVDAQSNPTIVADLKAFDKTFNIPDPPSFKIVNERGSTSPATLPAPDVGWAGEIALDVEWAHAIAPAASILLVESANLLTGVDYARKAPGVSVVSCSFGVGLGVDPVTGAFTEAIGQNSLDFLFTAPAGHNGVTFAVSAGDTGGPADWPSSAPSVISVGGTTLTLTATNDWSSETVWNNATGAGGGGVGLVDSLTGATIAQPEPVPSYQKGLGLSGRGTPDISYNADPLTGVAVFSTFALGGWEAIGGTSAGAPQWAGLIALANQGRAAIGKNTLSNAVSVLYSLPSSDFHDITVGNNDFFGLGLGVTGNAAGPGYDLASGLGTPIANLVIRDLVKASGISFVPSTFAAGGSPPSGFFLSAHPLAMASGGSVAEGPVANGMNGAFAIATGNSVAPAMQLLATDATSNTGTEPASLALDDSAPLTVAALSAKESSTFSAHNRHNHHDASPSSNDALDSYFAQLDGSALMQVA